MAAAEEAQNEISVENLVHVQNSAMVRPKSVKCPARFDARSTGIRPHRIFGMRSGEERRLARDRDEGSQQSRPKEQTPASLRLPEDKVTMFTDDSFRHAAVCAQTRRQGRSLVRTLLRFPLTQEACFATPSTCGVMTTNGL